MHLLCCIPLLLPLIIVHTTRGLYHLGPAKDHQSLCLILPELTGCVEQAFGLSFTCIDHSSQCDFTFQHAGILSSCCALAVVSMPCLHRVISAPVHPLHPTQVCSLKLVESQLQASLAAAHKISDASALMVATLGEALRSSDEQLQRVAPGITSLAGKSQTIMQRPEFWVYYSPGKHPDCHSVLYYVFDNEVSR